MADAPVNKTQLQLTAASLVGVAAGYAAGQHWLNLSVGDWTTVLSSIVAIATLVVPVVVARGKALKDQVGKLDHTVVVTDKASADSLPNNPDVIAATPAITAAIAKS